MPDTSKTILNAAICTYYLLMLPKYKHMYWDNPNFLIHGLQNTLFGVLQFVMHVIAPCAYTQHNAPITVSQIMSSGRVGVIGPNICCVGVGIYGGLNLNQ